MSKVLRDTTWVLSKFGDDDEYLHEIRNVGDTNGDGVQIWTLTTPGA